ncbi:SubName: Full=Uncharacterized protein {ECO:0000313/EMBL:CCA73236.1} [Serendipita indica DSM 11827]|uniref:Uncharacterized protein n=1 Tax=Serendipita indica (strain DSM 11827) TaxID=1109443 RepID=G4TPJ7_SERID|nr:SubName: Full=Uncharacterized protein {ECO:0000313/EMBL:CCA73236.1} [Serendipita indica DSM 11827]CCA73236.1 hypothetical protein PIIN_07191 [Serendipita indica DSM 11827]
MGDTPQSIPASSSTSFDPTSSVQAVVPSHSDSAIPLQSAQTSSNTIDHSNSDPISRPSTPVTPLPSPPVDRISRHKQKRIDSYSQIQIIRQIADEHARMSSDDTTTATTRSTAPPSECGSIDSEMSPSKLKPPEPKRRRSSRSAGERDDGACLLPSPPPPLLRPKTFWRNTPRSALGSPDYSPSTHLIRRSSFVVAGLEPSEPSGDIAALCIGSRPRPSHTVVLPPEAI